MMDELRALTDELHRTTEMLSQVLDRLDSAEERADKHQMSQRLLWLVTAAWIVFGAAFLWDAHNERDRICSALRGYSDAFTVAAVNNSDEPPDPERVASFKADMDQLLEACG